MLRVTDETKVEPTPTASDTQAGAPPALSADAAGKPAGLRETDLARLTDEVIGALKTVYDPETPPTSTRSAWSTRSISPTIAR
jgi:hypothetical protein